jgi:hypothetical protein
MQTSILTLESPDAQPYFLWDVPITVAELRQRLRHPEPRERALWMARVMREARYDDVWRFLSLRDVLEHYDLIQRHLGRRRRFWDFLLDGWRDDGLL